MTHKRYKPNQARTPWTRLKPREEKILDRGWHHIQSVPYRVSLRWLFYRLLQEGFYSGKHDYKNRFAKLISRARHTFFKKWKPYTLTDETRETIIRAGGSSNIEEAEQAMFEAALGQVFILLDHFYRQENYIELWFEARAMAEQFKYFTRRINLAPMGGSASIPFKWDIAQRLTWVAGKYEKPIKILYFGDEDEAGHVIQNTVEKDVRTWTRADFELVWCGLTEEQAHKYEVPLSIEGKGYQWEALSHEAAGEIITAAVESYIDLGIIEEVEEEGQEIEDYWKEKIRTLFEEGRE